METAALVSSIVSIIIGGFAIWLSVTFYKMSNKILEDTKNAAKGISSSVNRLESLFDSLYSDTFSMMKDTVTDMRKHIWPAKEKSAEEQKQIEEKADAKIEELKKEISNEVSGMMANVGEGIGRTEGKIDSIELRLEHLVNQAIQRTRKVESEAQEAKSTSELMEKIIKYINKRGSITIGVLLKIAFLTGHYEKPQMIAALEILIDNGSVIADSDLENPDTVLTLF